MMLHLCKGMNVAIEAVSCRGMKVTEEGADACYQNPRMPLILIPMPDHQSVWSMILIPFKLLSCNCFLPMDRVVGMSVGKVMTSFC